MPLRTRAVEIALERGWSIAELQRKSGLSQRVLYYLRAGRPPRAQTIEALMAVFPELAFDQLFVPSDSTIAELPSTAVETAA